MFPYISVRRPLPYQRFPTPIMFLVITFRFSSPCVMYIPSHSVHHTPPGPISIAVVTPSVQHCFTLWRFHISLCDPPMEVKTKTTKRNNNEIVGVRKGQRGRRRNTIYIETEAGGRRGNRGGGRFPERRRERRYFQTPATQRVNETRSQPC